MNENNLEIQRRLENEARFHDVSFTTDLRQKADKYYSIVTNSRDYYSKLINENIKGKKCLEYGCGTGSYGFGLAKEGADVTGIDISPIAIEVAKEIADKQGLNNQTEFLVMNAEDLKFPDETFDLICGTGIIHHLNLEKSFSEIKRVLKKNGKAVFSEPLGHNPIINWYRNRTPEMRTEDEHPLLIKDIEFAKKYFKKVDVKYFHILSLATVPFRNTFLFKPLYFLTELIDKVLMTIIPPLKSWAWMCNIELSK